MNHPIAQFVALTCHANAFLRGRSVPPFFPGNSTCVFCDWVKFVQVSKPLLGKLHEEEVAGSPDLWFAHLKGAGISAIRLSYRSQSHPKISDRMSAGFVGGGGTWGMEAVQQNGRRALWVSRWQVWDQNAPERRIWRVSYGRVSDTRALTPPLGDLEALAVRFRSALLDIRQFSERQQCGSFTARFSQAIETVDSGGAKRYGYHKDLAPGGALPSLAECLVDACQSAWVVGGMGSWNDLAFDGEAQTEYERTSHALFLTLTDVIQAAANASSPAGGWTDPSSQATRL
jgi:hypothetical protein